MRTIIIALSILGGLAATAQDTAAQDTTDKVSKPFEYQGYSEQQYGDLTVVTTLAPMSDGVELAVDYYLPTKGPDVRSFPVVLMYLPYQRSTIDIETGKVHDHRNGIGKFFTSHGYAVVAADMRGTGASTGWIHDFMPRVADDGKELVDWIAAQPWCDGNVGMMGASYLGWSQTATASRQPAALKCILPYAIPLEGYTGEVYPGGVYLQGFLNAWAGSMRYTQRNYNLAGKSRPTKPAIDEDGDGEWLDEIPIDRNGNGTFLDDGYPPKYRDDSPREHVYFKATREHDEGNYEYSEWAAVTPYIDGKSPLDYSMYDLGPNAHVSGVVESGIPMYHIVGWFDGFARGGLELYGTMAPTNPSKVVVAPSYHDFETGPFWAQLGHDPNTLIPMLLTEHLRYYDRMLKGIANGIDTEPPVLIYVMHGEGWRFEDEWPLARQTTQTLYLGEGHTLTAAPGAAGDDSYQADFTHNSSYGTNNGNRWLSIAGNAPNVVPTRNELDKQCLLYTSEAAKADMEITGHPILRLFVSSSAAYGDFFVYLEDVDPDGTATLVSEGLLRAGFAALVDNNRIMPPGERSIDVQPKLPWHGFEKEDYVDGIMADGKVVELVIDFQPTSWVLRTGHRLQIAVASADYPTFRLHPRLSPSNDPHAADNIVPTITVHHGDGVRSRLEIPVIPATQQ